MKLESELDDVRHELIEEREQRTLAEQLARVLADRLAVRSAERIRAQERVESWRGAA